MTNIQEPQEPQKLKTTNNLSKRAKIAFVLFTLFALLPIVANILGDQYLLVIGTRILAFAIAALALDLILGFGGMVSFGHAAYLGFGAYSVAILSSYGITDIFLHIIFGIIISLIFAAITGAISLRTKGVYFIMITLAFGQMAFFFFVSLSSFGGDDGITLQQRSTIFGWNILESDKVLFYGTLLMLTLLFFFSNKIVNSRFGRVLRSTQDNPIRAEALGFTPFGYQLPAFIISGCMTSIAGVILANQAEFVSPSFMSWHVSGELIVMVVLGGIGNLIGAIGGATIALLLEEFLNIFTEHWKFCFGIILILIVLYSPGGITGLFKRLQGRA